MSTRLASLPSRCFLTRKLSTRKSLAGLGKRSGMIKSLSRLSRFGDDEDDLIDASIKCQEISGYHLQVKWVLKVRRLQFDGIIDQEEMTTDNGVDESNILRIASILLARMKVPLPGASLSLSWMTTVSEPSTLVSLLSWSRKSSSLQRKLPFQLKHNKTTLLIKGSLGREGNLITPILREAAVEFSQESRDAASTRRKSTFLSLEAAADASYPAVKGWR